MVFAGLFLIWFAGNLGNIAAMLPLAKISLYHPHGIIALYAANHDNRRVLGTVVALIKLQAVIILVGHIFDVFDEAHRGVGISVTLIGGGEQYFITLLFRISAVLVEFAEHRFSFCLVSVLRIFQTLKTICFEFENFIEVVFGKHLVINGAIVGRVGI